MPNTERRQMIPRVFVVQDRNHNYLPAADFGELTMVFPGHQQLAFSPQPAIRHAREKLRGFTDEDYLLASGDPALIAIVCVVAADINMGRFKLLKWDRQEGIYYSLALDIFDRKEKERDTVA